MALKVPLTCTECAHERIAKNESLFDGTFRAVLVDINDDGVYTAKCENGHDMTAVWSLPRFELLFDAGALALANGYAREAIADFVGSLEDFFLFYARVVCRLHGVDAAHLDGLSKNVRLSERRWGMMYVAFLLHEKRPFECRLDSNKFRKLRNDVVHDGYICSREEAYEYAENVYDTIRPLITSLRAENGGADAIDEEIRVGLFHAFKKVPPTSKQRGGMAMRTLLGLEFLEPAKPFNEAYAEWLDLFKGIHT